MRHCFWEVEWIEVWVNAGGTRGVGLRVSCGHQLLLGICANSLPYMARRNGCALQCSADTGALWHLWWLCSVGYTLFATLSEYGLNLEVLWWCPLSFYLSYFTPLSIEFPPLHISIDDFLLHRFSTTQQHYSWVPRKHSAVKFKEEAEKQITSCTFLSCGSHVNFTEGAFHCFARPFGHVRTSAPKNYQVMWLNLGIDV